MKILVVSPFKVYPVNNGFATRAYNLIKKLSSHDEIFLLYINLNSKCINSDVDYLPKVSKHGINASKRWMQFFHPLLISKGVKIIRNNHIDLIIAESIWAGFHAMILSFLTKVPYCLTEQNVEYVRWKRMGMKYSSLLRIFEIYCCKFSKKVFCMSDSDRQKINKLGVDINKICIVPNGVDTLQFRADPSKKYSIAKELNLSVASPIIFFSGSLSYTPNLQAVQIIYEKIVNPVLEEIPNVKFVIVGSNPPLQFKHEAIIFAGFVEKIEDYLNASDIVIAPLISGGGTKLKIVEAIACGKIVITTSIGAEGLVDESTEGFLRIADDWNDFISIIVNSIKNPLVNDLPNKFIEKYSWESICANLSKEMSIY